MKAKEIINYLKEKIKDRKHNILVCKEGIELDDNNLEYHKGCLIREEDKLDMLKQILKKITPNEPSTNDEAIMTGCPDEMEDVSQNHDKANSHQTKRTFKKESGDVLGKDEKRSCSSAEVKTGDSYNAEKTNEDTIMTGCPDEMEDLEELIKQKLEDEK